MELADDLLHWQQALDQERIESTIVPRGLRPFDAEDADFFLDLLPGPRDRDGLPDSVRFWKTRIEELDPDKTFSVGLIYGPSGCGKTSLVKAALLPRLHEEVTAIYVEATCDDTEVRVLRSLRKLFPELPKHLGLVETFTTLRRERGTKVIVVLDQFEQWLHAHRGKLDTELVSALRQCDGGRVQAVVMVRDDFWMAASRFMELLDVPIVQGQNVTTVDLFDVDHAKKVLTKFGQAFGKLPAKLSEQSKKQRSFVSAVASALAQDGRVVSVHLTLIVEMMKSKRWIPATLVEAGSTEAVGVNFLEDTFCARTANPLHRRHNKAARNVLRALLPESGTDIKGKMKSYEELQTASGYADNPKDFEDLITILDGQVRLITPTDPEGIETDGSVLHIQSGQRYFQLTHDYLVQSLREWLTQKQRETRRGLAELRLVERAELWSSKPEVRQLPSLWEYLIIRALTIKNSWTEPQQRMMAKAGRVHGLRWAAVLVISMVVGVAARNFVSPQRADVPLLELKDDRNQPERADVTTLELKDDRNQPERADVTTLELDTNRKRAQRAVVATQKLEEERKRAEPSDVTTLELDTNRKQAERTVVATQKLEDERKRAEALVEVLLISPPDVVPYALQWLAPLREHATEILQDRFDGATIGSIQRLHAAIALAEFGQSQTELIVFIVTSIEDATRDEVPNIVSALSHAPNEARALLRQQTAKAEARNNWQYMARLAIVAAHLGDIALSSEMLQFEQRPDPIQRTVFIEIFSTWHFDLNNLAELIADTSDPALRSGLCLAVGSVEDVNDEAKRKWQRIFAKWYVNDPDAGTHSASSWALRNWQLDPPEIPESKRERSDHNWMVTPMGLTMVRVPAGKIIGNDRQGQTKIREFFLCDREVTVNLFEEFMNDEDYEGHKPEMWQGASKSTSPSPDHPVQLVSWYAAVMFCNWLSNREGLAACYELTGEKEVLANPSGERYEKDAWRLTDAASGYRLPTAAEWEHACRAGTTTDFAFGGDLASRLTLYGVFAANSNSQASVGGTKMCNAWGLFDMHGNVYEWCWAWAVPGSFLRVRRGGSWFIFAEYCRSSHRTSSPPTLRLSTVGFRVALDPLATESAVENGGQDML